MSEEENWDAVADATEMLHDGEADAAIESLTSAIAANDRNEYAHYYLGQAYFEKKQFDRALKCYVEAVGLKPRYLGAMLGAGHCLRLLGEHEKALRMGKQILIAQKDDADGLYLMGLTHFQRGEAHAATEFLTKFLETGPEYEVAQEVDGMLKLLRGEVQPEEPEPQQ